MIFKKPNCLFWILACFCFECGCDILDASKDFEAELAGRYELVRLKFGPSYIPPEGTMELGGGGGSWFMHHDINRFSGNSWEANSTTLILTEHTGGDRIYEWTLSGNILEMSMNDGFVIYEWRKR